MTRPGRRAALLLGLGGAVTGCGFHPVYAPEGNGPGAEAGLAAIEVKPIYERPGQILRDALLGRLRTQPDAPRRFDLQVTFWITGQAQGILNFTAATRLRTVANATWVLLSRDGKQTRLVEGSDQLIDGFDVFATQYFTIDLDNAHVQQRLAEAMAERIALRLAIWFRQNPSAMA